MKSKTNRKIELKKSTIAIPLLRKLTGGQCLISDDTEPIQVDSPTGAEISFIKK